MDNWVPVPIMVDGREVMLGVSINRWNVPPELNAALVELERRRAEMATLTPADKQTAVEPAPDAKPGFSWFKVLPFVLLAAVCVFLAVAVAVPTLRGMKRRKRSK